MLNFQRNQALVSAFTDLHQLHMSKKQEQLTAILHNAFSVYPEDGVCMKCEDDPYFL